MASNQAILMAGIPASNAALFHRLRFSVGEPTAFIQLVEENQSANSILILRDIEMERARANARVDQVGCPADYTPEGGLSGDRETATAQAAAECLRRHGVQRVTADRSLPLIYADFAQQAGITVELDGELGVLDRRFGLGTLFVKNCVLAKKAKPEEDIPPWSPTKLEKM